MNKVNIRNVKKIVIKSDSELICFLPNCANTIGYGSLIYYGENNSKYLNKEVIFQIKKNEFEFSVLN